MDEEPRSGRAWWEWVLIGFGVVIVALGGLCLLIILSIQGQY